MDRAQGFAFDLRLILCDFMTEEGDVLQILIKITRSAVFTAMLILAQTASAQSLDLENEGLLNLGDGVVLEVVPPVFETISEVRKEPSEEWVTIPAVFETINETVVIQEGYTELKVIPAILTDDGSRLEPAQASLVDIPAVTKKVTRRVVKIPAKVVKRTIPCLCTPQTMRRKVTETVYIFRDELGAEVARYDDPLFAMRFIERLKN